MKRILVYIFFCLFISNISGQNIGLSGGIIRNNFFDLQKQEDTPYSANYTPGYGYSFGICLSDFKLDDLPMEASIGIETYKGKFMNAYQGLGGANKTEADVEKTNIVIGIYPYNFSVSKKIKLSLGGQFSFKIHDRTTGYKSYWTVAWPYPTHINIENDSVKINKNFFLGFSGKVRYDFRIVKDWCISPQYRFYFGITKEFINTEAIIRSMRHNFEIVLSKRIK